MSESKLMPPFQKQLDFFAFFFTSVLFICFFVFVITKVINVYYRKVLQSRNVQGPYTEPISMTRQVTSN